MQVKVLAKRVREKHILEVEESSIMLHFASASQDRPTCEVLTKHSTLRILSVTFLPFTHTIYIYPYYPQSKRDYSKRKILDRFSTTQHTHLLEKESYLSLVRNYCRECFEI